MEKGSISEAGSLPGSCPPHSLFFILFPCRRWKEPRLTHHQVEEKHLAGHFSSLVGLGPIWKHIFGNNDESFQVATQSSIAEAIENNTPTTTQDDVALITPSVSCLSSS